MTDFDWTPQAIAKLETLWMQSDPKLSSAHIGRCLGISKNAVVGKAHRIGLPARPSQIKPSHGGYSKKPRPVRLPGAQINRHVAVPLPKPVQEVKPIFVQPRVSRHQCSWPLGEPGTESFSFCDERAVANKPYCAAHCERAYVKTARQDGVGA